jgi:hypothetical protein
MYVECQVVTRMAAVKKPKPRRNDNDRSNSRFIPSNYDSFAGLAEYVLAVAASQIILLVD